MAAYINRTDPAIDGEHWTAYGKAQDDDSDIPPMRPTCYIMKHDDAYFQCIPRHIVGVWPMEEAYDQPRPNPSQPICAVLDLDLVTA